MANESCCIFCLKVFQKQSPEVEDNLDVQTQFLKFFRRHLMEDAISLRATSPAANGALYPCPDCCFVLNSFCEFYKESKILEMKMKWRTSTLMDIVHCSGKSKSRTNSFKDKIGAMEVTERADREEDFGSSEFIQKVFNFRQELVEKCSDKLRSGFPKVILREVQPGAQTSILKRKSKPVADEAPVVKLRKLTPKAVKFNGGTNVKELSDDRCNAKSSAEAKATSSTCFPEPDEDSDSEFGNVPEHRFSRRNSVSELPGSRVNESPSNSSDRTRVIERSGTPESFIFLNGITVPDFETYPMLYDYLQVNIRGDDSNNNDDVFSEVNSGDLPEKTEKTEKSYICLTCGFKTNKEKNLKRHEKRHLDPANWTHTCGICGRKFYDAVYLRRHKKLCSSESSTNNGSVPIARRNKISSTIEI